MGERGNRDGRRLIRESMRVTRKGKRYKWGRDGREYIEVEEIRERAPMTGEQWSARQDIGRQKEERRHDRIQGEESRVGEEQEKKEMEQGRRRTLENIKLMLIDQPCYSCGTGV